MKAHLAAGALALASLLGASGLAAAAEVKGALLDVACSTDTLKDGYRGALAHERECALMTPCVKSGYGVVTEDGKFIKFDQAGNDKTLEMLKNTDKADNLKITVTGDVQGETMTVSSIALQ